ncbi:hypothetical protein HNY73_017511 [Argiope bruennichi]|uniref:Uncharacterized protein n=1 Tax=Argiope bruennichi TaxID=94029 RepID=A0A8T0EB53_ARGBR|nr:hypothetical protein HNY73_017511 [Argiope bruennichi]
MISNQELLKKLIFLSILWATISSGSSHWRRKVVEDGTLLESRKENGAVSEVHPIAKRPTSWRSYSHRMNSLHQYRQLNDEQSSAQLFTQPVSVNESKSTKLEIRNLLSVFENENKTSGEKVDSFYFYRNGKEENGSSLGPAWQLPKQKNLTFNSNKTMKILPMSSIHELWHATKRILMTDYRNFTNASSPISYYKESHVQKDDTGTSRKDQASQKGDSGKEILNTGESRGYHNGGMSGGSQPILLIKDKGDGGGGEMNGNMGIHGKEAIGPLIMMLTPLIMMCIMMPMMMSIMGGMMNFMKGIATMMIMVSNPLPGIGGQLPSTLLNKHRKTDDDNVSRGRVLLGSLIMEVAEKLETALSKYDM